MVAVLVYITFLFQMIIGGVIKMNDEDIMIAILIGVGLLFLVFVLALPVTGTIAGISFSLPLIGWIAFTAFAVIALYLFFKHRA